MGVNKVVLEFEGDGMVAETLRKLEARGAITYTPVGKKPRVIVCTNSDDFEYGADEYADAEFQVSEGVLFITKNGRTLATHAPGQWCAAYRV